MSLYRNGLQEVMARVAGATAAAHHPATVRLVAVSKSFPPTAVRAVHALGLTDFGENYVQEALDKMAALTDLPDLVWHFIGPVQSNKAKPVAERFAWVHTIDRLKIAERLSAARPLARAPLNVCIQVNISGEPAKSGLPADAAVALAPAIAALPRLTLRGFMGIAEASADSLRQRAQFGIARHCLERCRASGLALDTLSMGMSGDLEAAIAEGATMVRVGSAIFGARNPT